LQEKIDAGNLTVAKTRHLADGEIIKIGMPEKLIMPFKKGIKPYAKNEAEIVAFELKL
jgi:hypothetical protein